MKNVNWEKILEIPEYLKRNRIVRPEGGLYGLKWASDLVRYFEAEQAAESVTYPAIYWLDGKPYEGEIEISRDGWLDKRLNHGAA